MRNNLNLVIPEHFRLLAPWGKIVNQTHDDLLEHEDGQEKTTDIDQFIVDEGSPGHAQITVEETEGVTLLDTRFFVLLFVLFVLQINDFGRNLLEIPVEVDDGDRVNENVDPKTRHLVLLVIETIDLQHPISELLHAEVPDAPGNGHRNEYQDGRAEKVLDWVLNKYRQSLLARYLLHKVS